jgi:ComF family protein
MLRNLLEVMYPRSCVGCGSGRWPFCPGCSARLTTFLPPRCARCGLPTPEPTDSCPACPSDPVALTRAPFLFDGPVRAAVLRLKFGGERDVARALGRATAAVVAREADVITWVPLSRARRRERGFDQAELLARSVAREMSLPCRRLLTRRVDLAPQARRSGIERRTALAGVFETASDPPARVLVVDDVMTTGSTAAECARTLVRAGAREVDVATSARTRLLSSNRLQPGSVVARGISPR